MDNVSGLAQDLDLEEAQQDSDALLQNLVLALPAAANLDLNDEAALLPQGLLQEIQDLAPLGIHQEHGVHNQHLQVRFVKTYDSMVAGPMFGRFRMQLPSQKAPTADLFRLWGKFFSPIGDPQYQIPAKLNWAPFITVKLLNDNSFSWAKAFLESQGWSVIQGDEPI